MSIHYRTLCIALSLLSGVANAGERDMDGEYACKVQNSIGIPGIVHKGESQPLGAFAPGEEWAGFYLTIAFPKPMRSAICREYLDFFASRLDKNTGLATPYETEDPYMQLPETFAITCTARMVMETKYLSGKTETYYAIKHPYFGRSLSPGSWLSLFGDGAFEMGFSTGYGPAVAIGECKKLH